jgi:hypothetical protein
MDPEPEYRSRHDVLEQARTFRLGEAGLLIADDAGPPAVLAYAEIRQVRLRFFPTRVQTNRFECLVDAPGRTLKFSNEFYRGIASFDDQSASYRKFVTALCRRVAAANPRATFLTGRDGWVLGLEWSFLLLMALLLGWILWITDSPLGWLIWVKLGLIVVFLPTLWRYFKRSRATRFDPQAIPEDVLPAADGAS